MKRKDLIKHLNQYGCIICREGSKHSIFINPINEFKAAVPRHVGLKNNTCKEICKQLGIPQPL